LRSRGGAAAAREQQPLFGRAGANVTPRLGRNAGGVGRDDHVIEREHPLAVGVLPAVEVGDKK